VNCMTLRALLDINEASLNSEIGRNYLTGRAERSNPKLLNEELKLRDCFACLCVAHRQVAPLLAMTLKIPVCKQQCALSSMFRFG